MPTDIVFQVLLCRLRYKMSLRDVAEFFFLRGFEFTPAERRRVRTPATISGLVVGWENSCLCLNGVSCLWIGYNSCNLSYSPSRATLLFGSRAAFPEAVALGVARSDSLQTASEFIHGNKEEFGSSVSARETKIPYFKPLNLFMG